MNKLSITTDKLLIIAGGLWIIAGISIAQIGIVACANQAFAF
jgi:hypothetical protein